LGLMFEFSFYLILIFKNSLFSQSGDYTFSYFFTNNIFYP
jgi:hypothetical protein